MKKFILILLFVAGLSTNALGEDTWTEPHSGIRHLHRTTSEPWNINTLIVDLSNPAISVRATRSEDRGITTSRFASRYGVEAAINGDFFSYDGYPTIGLAIGDGERWPGSSDKSYEGFLAFGDDNRVYVSPDEEVMEPVPEWMKQVVGGQPIIVWHGSLPQSLTHPDHINARHPRTAVGVSADSKTLYMVTVDGRRAGVSIGMTGRELGQLMLNLGAYDALNLDGGGSTTMWVSAEGGVVNVVSGNSERAVANHLGIEVGTGPPTGELVGLIREGDIYNEEGGIAGARVEINSGEATNADERGFYIFPALVTAEYTITASAAGYIPASATKTVEAGIRNWKSIALQRAEPQPDGGVDTPDASSLPGQDAGTGDAHSPELTDPDPEGADAEEIKDAGHDASAETRDTGEYFSTEASGGCSCSGSGTLSVSWWFVVPITCFIPYYSRRHRRKNGARQQYKPLGPKAQARWSGNRCCAGYVRFFAG